MTTKRLVTFGTGRHKYFAKPTEFNGRKYPSKAQAERARQLAVLERVGAIRNLREEVRYAIQINGVKVCEYRADFVYEESAEGGWREVVADVKGYRTPIYKLKKKLMLACHSIEIEEQ